MAANIIQSVSASFEGAQASGDVLFFPSTVHKHVEAGIEYEIRLCPALQKKPKLETPHFVTVVGLENGSANNPFLPPYVPALLVGELNDTGEEFVVLLNKFSVVPSHFLMVTKEFQSQASPLLPKELLQTYLLLRSATHCGQRFFAFYNCGDRSGASQPHKHVQFMPLSATGGPPIELLAQAAKLDDDEKPFSLSSLPYANHIRRLPRSLPNALDEELEEVLATAYMTLLDRVFSTIRQDETYPAGSPSYNMILTLEHLYLIPRKQENHTLSVTGDKLSVNSLGFAGMLLVKSEAELDAVKEEGVQNILRGVGLQNVHLDDVQLSDLHS